MIYLFSTEQGRAKWIKAASLLCLTFTYDFIISYEIVRKINITVAVNEFGEQPHFNLMMCLADPQFYLLIFGGFLVYIVWGLVLTYFEKSYNQVYPNEPAVQKIKFEIEDLEKRIKEDDNLIEEEKMKKIQLSSNKNLPQIIIYDQNKLNNLYSNFYLGWVRYLNEKKVNSDIKFQTQNIYKLFKNKEVQNV